MKFRLPYITFMLILTSCSTTRNWQSEQHENSFSASYDKFNGKEIIKVKKDSNKVAYLTYLANNSQGKFNLKINRDEFNFVPGKIEHLKFDLNNPLIFQLKGENAEGGFQLEYPTYRKKEIEVQYNSNFELLSLAYFLSNMYEDLKENNNTFDYEGREVKVKDLFSLNLKVAKRFERYLESENLDILNEYFEKQWYLDYAKFVINLPDFPYSQFPEEISGSNNLFDTVEEEQRFIIAMNKFSNEINFSDFLKDYHPYYNQMVKEVKDNLPNESFITEMEHLYNEEANGYFLNASLTMPFSQGFAIAQKDSIGYVFGSLTLPLETDDLNNLKLGYANSNQLRNISVHEFGHSFVNPVIDEIDDSVINKKEFLFEPIKEEMSNQAYSNWKIALYEHFVRAGEIFIAEQLKDEKTATELSQDYIENRQFIYLNQIIPAMKNWYNNQYFTTSYFEFVKETIEKLDVEPKDK